MSSPGPRIQFIHVCEAVDGGNGSPISIHGIVDVVQYEHPHPLRGRALVAGVAGLPMGTADYAVHITTESGSHISVEKDHVLVEDADPKATHYLRVDLGKATLPLPGWYAVTLQCGHAEERTVWVECRDV